MTRIDTWRWLAYHRSRYRLIVTDVYRCTAFWGHTKYLYVRPDGGLVITNTVYSRHKSHNISQGWVAFHGVLMPVLAKKSVYGPRL